MHQRSFSLRLLTLFVTSYTLCSLSFGEDPEFMDAKEKAEYAQKLAKTMQAESIAQAAAELATQQYDKAAKHFQQFSEGIKAEKKNNEREKKAEKHSDAAQRELTANGLSSRPSSFTDNRNSSQTNSPLEPKVEAFRNPTNNVDFEYSSSQNDLIKDEPTDLLEPVLAEVEPIEAPELKGPDKSKLKAPVVKAPKDELLREPKTPLPDPELALVDPTLNPPPFIELWPELKPLEAQDPKAEKDQEFFKDKAKVEDGKIKRPGREEDKKEKRPGREIATVKPARKKSVLDEIRERLNVGEKPPQSSATLQ